MTMSGQRLLDLDVIYYFGLMNLTIRNQPNSVGKAHDDKGVKDIAISSMWRCGDNGWIAFEQYCEGGVTTSGDADNCVRATPSVA